jgi:hypothetical protein
MKIGEDYPKIHQQVFDLELLEPNAFVGDLVLGLVSCYFGYRVFTILRVSRDKFHLYWCIFFFLNSATFLVGGLGHLFYIYWGLQGKFIAWFLGILSIFMLERAVISVLQTEKWLIKNFSTIKLYLTLIALVISAFTINFETDPFLGLIIPFSHSFLGLSIYCGYYGFHLAKTQSDNFIFLVYAYLLYFPIFFIQLLKIKIHQYFDRNDLSHVILLCSLFFLFKTARHISRPTTAPVTE